MPKNKKLSNMLGLQAMAYSGVHELELKAFVRELEERGSTNIQIEPDDGDYTGHPEGPYFVVSYSRAKPKHRRKRHKSIQDSSSQSSKQLSKPGRKPRAKGAATGKPSTCDPAEATQERDQQ